MQLHSNSYLYLNISVDNGSKTAEANRENVMRHAWTNTIMTLNWGQITPEGTNRNENEFLYVYNHDLSSSEKVDRTIRFIVGRLNYYDNHLPKNPRHQIKIDIRGQAVDNKTCEFIVQTITQNYKASNILNIDFVK